MNLINYFKKLLHINTMKYWICKDIDNKIYLYCGKSRPHYDENQGFDG